MKTLWSYIKSEAVLVISFGLAAVSAFVVPPDSAYPGYIDWRTLGLLLCLMAVVSGLNRLGVFRALAGTLLHRVRTMRSLALTLCLLCFFLSMVITNDVALITFVPFSVVVLRCSGQERRMIPLITLETVAANLGSMLTPVGNPQNLYLFSAYDMGIGEFFAAVAPYGLFALALVSGGALLVGRERLAVPADNREPVDKLRAAVYSGLFLLALCTVFRILPWMITLGITVAVILVTDRKTMYHVDYSLLLTFVFLFVFIGNLGRMDAVSAFLQRIVSGREVLVGVLASQVFSNVPAAILLSGFTAEGTALLVGTNLGGLGTLIASMASIISFKFIAKGNVSTGKYVLFFTAVNVLFLALELGLWAILR